MNGYWIALAIAAGFLIGYVVALGVVGVSHADNEQRLQDELAAARRQLAFAQKDRHLYDWAIEEEQTDALTFSERMVVELGEMVGSLRSVCYEAIAWLDSRPDMTEGDAATASRIRGVLEDIEALEEAR